MDQWRPGSGLANVSCFLFLGGFLGSFLLWALKAVHEKTVLAWVEPTEVFESSLGLYQNKQGIRS